MQVQYITDTLGLQSAVVIPIAEWNELRDKYPEVDGDGGEVSQWMKDFITQRLQHIAEHPEAVRPIEELYTELDRIIAEDGGEEF